MDSATSPAAGHRDLVTVDLRGMKPALLARAAARGVSASALVREVLAAAGVGATDEPAPAGAEGCDRPRVRIGLRLAADEARELAARAAAAGLPVGAFVVAAVRAGGEVLSAEQRDAQVAVLTRSNAELAAVSRHLGHLTSLLRMGAVDAARQYRERLDTLNADVRAHLALSAELLSERWPRPSRHSTNPRRRYARPEVD